MFSAKSQTYKAKALYNSAKIATGEVSALDSTKTQAYRAKAPLGNGKKASCEAIIASCEARMTAAPSSAKSSCKAKLASGKASVVLSKAKATTFRRLKSKYLLKRLSQKPLSKLTSRWC